MGRMQMPERGGDGDVDVDGVRKGERVEKEKGEQGGEGDGKKTTVLVDIGTRYGRACIS